jgi:hypothetical protein
MRAAIARGRRLVPWVLGALVTTYAPALSAQALITGLSDLALGRWNGGSDLQGEVDHCVYARPGGRFSVAATGVGSAGAFVLQNGPGTLPFRVDYNDGSGWSQLNPGVPLSGQRGEPNLVQLTRCLLGQRPPERVRVRILAQDLAAAPAGSYDGSLTLLITPE